MIGLALFFVRGIWMATPDRATLEIPRSEIADSISAYETQIGRPATDEEKRGLEDQIIESALWLAQARALGLHRSDSVVRRRLIQNMRFLDEAGTLEEDALVDRAFELGLDSSDDVVRRRLIDRVQALLRAGIRSRTPAESDLRRYYSENADRWSQPALLDLSHIYFSRDKRRESTQKDADALLQVLIEQDTFSETAIQSGDPFLSGHRLRNVSSRQIGARLGPEFEAGTQNAETGRWIGPVESTFGSHLIWIHQRVPERIPDFEEIRSRIREHWFEEETRHALRREIDRYRLNVEIRIIQDAEDSHIGGRRDS